MSSEFGTYRLCEQRRFRRACASAQSRQNLRCSLIQAVTHEEPSDRKPDPWPLWMAGHAQLKFVMTECSRTQIHLIYIPRKRNHLGCINSYYRQLALQMYTEWTKHIWSYLRSLDKFGIELKLPNLRALLFESAYLWYLINKHIYFKKIRSWVTGNNHLI